MMTNSPSLPIGVPLPPNTPHAVSVSLPTWQHNVDYEEGMPAVVAAMKSGYPRFVFHPSVKKLFAYCASRFASQSESVLILSARIHAQAARSYILSNAPSCPIRIIELVIPPHSHKHRYPDKLSNAIHATLEKSITHPALHVIVFPSSVCMVAKQFWQHSGEGISSRFADHCLRALGIDSPVPTIQNASKLLILQSDSSHGRSSRYTSSDYLSSINISDPTREISLFVEERFGRNLDLRFSTQAKTVLRRRIAGLIGDSASDNINDQDLTNTDTSSLAHISREIPSLSESDVFLFPCGMSAIYNLHRAILRIHPMLKTVQFGFPYIDTLKIQERFGPGCHFFGHGSSEDLDALEELLQSGTKISAIFCEFPSNPLLKCADLDRLSRIAQDHNVILVIDETIGNFCNVNVLRYANAVVSSLTKVFSGDSNVMGGSIVLNPNPISSSHEDIYATLKSALQTIYIDTMYPEDAIYLERNSRSFVARNHRINRSTETLCGFLASHPKVKCVMYPKYGDREVYEKYARIHSSNLTSNTANTEEESYVGYGGLFSMLLHSPDATTAPFFDALNISKGPSLGTNFTLACPYTILAHYGELDWANDYGVSKWLIRVSVGLEPIDELIQTFKSALDVV